MSLPNILSFLRLLAGPFILMKMHQGTPEAGWWILVAACITDALDGWIARRFHQETMVGKYLDPLADKVLMTCLVIGLYYHQKIGCPYFTITILRELLIIVGVLILRIQGRPFQMEPLPSSKISTILQMGYCCIVYINWVFHLGISAEILYDGEIIVIVSILYSFLQYARLWWKIQKKA